MSAELGQNIDWEGGWRPRPDALDEQIAAFEAFERSLDSHPLTVAAEQLDTPPRTSTGEWD